VRIELRTTAKPTVGDALARLVTSLPSMFVLCVLWFVSGILTVAGILMILIDQRVPQGILSFQTGILRWQARLFAYHASLVDDYPPFSFGDRATPEQGATSGSAP
jgi:hypothetical protein